MAVASLSSRSFACHHPARVCLHRPGKPFVRRRQRVAQARLLLLKLAQASDALGNDPRQRDKELVLQPGRAAGAGPCQERLPQSPLGGERRQRVPEATNLHRLVPGGGNPGCLRQVLPEWPRAPGGCRSGRRQLPGPALKQARQVVRQPEVNVRTRRRIGRTCRSG